MHSWPIPTGAKATGRVPATRGSWLTASSITLRDANTIFLLLLEREELPRKSFELICLALGGERRDIEIEETVSETSIMQGSRGFTAL